MRGAQYAVTVPLCQLRLDQLEIFVIAVVSLHDVVFDNAITFVVGVVYAYRNDIYAGINTGIADRRLRLGNFRGLQIPYVTLGVEILQPGQSVGISQAYHISRGVDRTEFGDPQMIVNIPEFVGIFVNFAVYSAVSQLTCACYPTCTVRVGGIIGKLYRNLLFQYRQVKYFGGLYIAFALQYRIIVAFQRIYRNKYHVIAGILRICTCGQYIGQLSVRQNAEHHNEA